MRRKLQFGGEVRVQLLRLSEPEAAPRGDTPKLAEEYWRDRISKAPWFDPEKEMAVVLCLNTKNSITAFSLVSIGALSETIVEPREVFRAAIAANSYGVVVMHNHPSGNPSPSKGDNECTARLIEAGRILGIRLVDHVIIGTRARGRGLKRWFSFREIGMIG